MPVCQLHHIAFTLPAPLKSGDLPQLVQELFGIPGLEPEAVRLPRGRHGYREAYSLTGEHGAELISFLLSGVAANLKGTAHIVVHGAALETGSIDVAHICREIVARNGWGTRVDLAADDKDGVLPWSEILECSAVENWAQRISTTTCRARKNPKTGEMMEQPPVYLRSAGETVYFGRADSDLSICAYTRRGPIRVETRIRNRAATTEIIRRLAEGEDIGAITAGILRRNLRFHEAGNRRKDRRPVCAWWDRFLGAVEPIKLPRQRAKSHCNPWYTPPTRADKAGKAASRYLLGDGTDGPVVERLRQVIEETERKAAYDKRLEEWDKSDVGILRCDYLSQFSTPPLDEEITNPLYDPAAASDGIIF